jgi:hypothetical protein
MHPYCRVGAPASFFVLALSGCSGASLPELPKLALPAGAAYSEPPAEIYTRIARGAMSCWFGSFGPLKGTHIFNAEVAPPSENAGAEIVIHERDPAAPSPRALRAYRIDIKRAPEGTFVAVENLKLREPLAAAMQEDVKRWAGGATGCSSSVPEAWGARPAQPSERSTGAVPVSNTGPRR